MEPTATMGRPRIDEGIVAKLRELLDAGTHPTKISEDCGVSVSTVYNQRRIWQELKEKGRTPQGTDPTTTHTGDDVAAA